MKASDFYRELPTYYGRVQGGKLVIEDPQVVATETKEFFDKLDAAKGLLQKSISTDPP